MDEEIVIEELENEEIVIDESSSNEEVIVENDEVINIGIDAESYKGKYTIIPLAFQEQKLETKNKVLKENVIVKEVPYYETSNKQGTTIYIGSEV